MRLLLGCLLAALALAANPIAASASRPPTKTEARTLKHAFLRACHSHGASSDCRFSRSNTRVSTGDPRYAFADGSDGQGFNGVYLRRARSNASRWTTRVVQGGGLIPCSRLEARLPDKVLIDLEVAGYEPGQGSVACVVPTGVLCAVNGADRVVAYNLDCSTALAVSTNPPAAGWKQTAPDTSRGARCVYRASDEAGLTLVLSEDGVQLDRLGLRPLVVNNLGD